MQSDYNDSESEHKKLLISRYAKMMVHQALQADCLSLSVEDFRENRRSSVARRPTEEYCRIVNEVNEANEDAKLPKKLL